MTTHLFAFLCLLHIPLFCSLYSSSYNNSLSCDYELLSAQEYHNSVLRGELLGEKNSTDQFLSFSNLIPIGQKVGASTGGLFRDAEGRQWIVKQGQNSINEYLGARLMRLLLPSIPEVKLFNDKPGFTASKYLPNFRMQSFIKSKSKKLGYKRILGECELNIAMDLIGLGDRNYANIGYIEDNDVLIATRVDFDNSFQHFNFNSPLDLKLCKTIEIYKNLNEAIIYINHIASITDASIFYILGNAYKDLLTVGADFSPEHYKNLAPAFIERKAQLLTLLKNHHSEATPQDNPIPEAQQESNSDLNINCEQDMASLNWLIQDRRFDFLNLLIEHCFNSNSNNEDSGTLLHWATFEGKIDIVQLLLENAIDPNLQAKNGVTALHQAVKTNQYSVLQLLLRYNADPNVQDHQGYSPLHCAINMQNLHLAQLLLHSNADPNIQDNQGLTPLHWAINKQNLQLVQSLLHYDADPNFPDNQNITPFDLAIKKGYSDIIEELKPLHYAAKHNHLETLELLLQRGINPNTQDNRGCTPMHWAVQSNNIDLIQLLLDYNADLNIQNLDGATPLHWSATFSDLEILKFLQSLVDPNIQGNDITTIMHWAASSYQWNIVKYALDHGADPSTNDSLGYTLLDWAILYGNFDILKLLLEEYNMDPNSENSYKFMPLHLAIEKGHLHLVKLLLQKNASPNFENQNGQTPLVLAAEYQQLEIIETLIDYGLDIKLHVGANSSLLQTLVARNKMGSFKLLLEKGANPNTIHNKDDTVLDATIRFGRIEALQPLLDHNVDLNLKDKNGQTPYDKAIKANRLEMVQLMEQKMAKNNFFLSIWIALKQLLK